VRIHYAYVDGGGATNVVPATASASLWIRDSEMGSVLELLERAKVMAQGAAMAAGVEAEVILITGTYSIINNSEAAKVVHANMLQLGPVEFTAAENAFARDLQKAMGVAELGLNGSVEPLDLDATDITGGSTDVADVSWIVPTIDFNVVTAPVDIPWHSWGVVASSGMSIGHRGMHYASKVLATSMVDLFTSPKTVEAIQAQFREDTSGLSYRAYIPEGPPPIPKTE
jgi:aminobenzoyl-glutamate utilization protein B